MISKEGISEFIKWLCHCIVLENEISSKIKIIYLSLEKASHSIDNICLLVEILVDIESTKCSIYHSKTCKSIKRFSKFEDSLQNYFYFDCSYFLQSQFYSELMLISKSLLSKCETFWIHALEKLIDVYKVCAFKKYPLLMQK